MQRSNQDPSFEFLADLMPDFIARYDRHCRIQFINRPLSMILHLNNEDVYNKTPDEFFKGRAFPGIQKEISRCMQTGEVVSIDISGECHGGKLGFFSIRFIAERNATGEVVGCIAIGRDLTERNGLKLLGRMAAGICHEVNNPLAIISATSQLLKKETDREARLSVGKIDESVTRISDILESLLLFSVDVKSEERRFISLRDVLSQAVQIWKDRFLSHHIRVYESFLDMPDERIYYHPSQLIRTLSNLLSNAFDATHQAEEPWVKIELEYSDHYAILSFTNSGPLIPLDNVELIMQPFFTTKQIGKGKGLGLSVANGIAESHGGRLYYDRTSALAKFILELPRTVSY